MDLSSNSRTRLVMRVDDVGFCHAANVAFDRIAATGIVSAASVMLTTPWLDEAVEILARHPHVSVGVHLVLNCEWTNFRWGPISPVSEVPSLVDEWGKLWPTRAALNANGARMEEIETELRAQIALALKRGLRISYLDSHMAAASESLERRALLRRLADEHGFALSCWFGEKRAADVYSEPPERKADVLVERLSALTKPDLRIAIFHPGMNVDEMNVLRDANVGGLPNVGAHRQAETDAMCDPRVRRVIEEKGIEVIGYDRLREFREQMVDPGRAC